MLAVIGLILLIYGLIKACFGYKLYRLSLFFTGFLVGAVIGGIIGAASSGAAVAIIAGLILGILCGILNVFLLKVGIFIQCFVYGFMAVMIPSIISQLVDNANLNSLLNIGMNLLSTGSTGVNLFSALPIALVVALIVGILGVIISRILIILTTGIFGGMIGGAGLCIMISQFNLTVLIIAAMFLAVLGIIVQMKTTNKSKEESASAANREISADSNIGAMDGASISSNSATAKGAAFQAQASQTMDSIRENGERALGAAKMKGEEGIASLKAYHDNAVNNALSFETNLSLEEIFKAMEKNLFQNTVMSWVLPFIEVITVVVALLFLLLVKASYSSYGNMAVSGGSYFNTYILYLRFGTPLFLAACLLGVIQRKHVYVLCVLGAEILINLYPAFTGWGAYYIILVLFYIGLMVLYILYYKNVLNGTKEVPKVISYGNKTMQTNSTNSFVQTEKFCGKCGNKVSENTRFCAKCGNKIS